MSKINEELAWYENPAQIKDKAYSAHNLTNCTEYTESTTVFPKAFVSTHHIHTTDKESEGIFVKYCISRNPSNFP